MTHVYDRIGVGGTGSYESDRVVVDLVDAEEYDAGFRLIVRG